MYVEITSGRNPHAAGKADAWQVTIEGKERKPGYFKWVTFATEKESHAYAEGAVIGAAIQAGQYGLTDEQRELIGVLIADTADLKEDAREEITAAPEDWGAIRAAFGIPTQYALAAEETAS